MVGLLDGSMAIQLVIRSASAGDKGERSTTVKSFDRSACQATPPSGTQILVATSRSTRPKLDRHQYCGSGMRQGCLPENVRGHDKYTLKHLGCHVDSITLTFKLGHSVWKGKCPTKA
jgi:hypothetical protein